MSCTYFLALNFQQKLHTELSFPMWHSKSSGIFLVELEKLLVFQQKLARKWVQKTHQASNVLCSTWNYHQFLVTVERPLVSCVWKSHITSQFAMWVEVIDSEKSSFSSDLIYYSQTNNATVSLKSELVEPITCSLF